MKSGFFTAGNKKGDCNAIPLSLFYNKRYMPYFTGLSVISNSRTPPARSRRLPSSWPRSARRSATPSASAATSATRSAPECRARPAHAHARCRPAETNRPQARNGFAADLFLRGTCANRHAVSGSVQSRVLHPHARWFTCGRRAARRHRTGRNGCSCSRSRPRCRRSPSPSGRPDCRRCPGRTPPCNAGP